MAAVEALKAIDILQSIVEARMRDVEDMLEGVGDIMLQGFDEMKKDISQKGIYSTQITAQLVLFTTHNVFMVRYRERAKSEGKSCRQGAE